MTNSKADCQIQPNSKENIYQRLNSGRYDTEFDVAFISQIDKKQINLKELALYWDTPRATHTGWSWGRFNADLAGLARFAEHSPSAHCRDLPLLNLNCCDSMSQFRNTGKVPGEQQAQYCITQPWPVWCSACGWHTHYSTLVLSSFLKILKKQCSKTPFKATSGASAVQALGQHYCWSIYWRAEIQACCAVTMRNKENEPKSNLFQHLKNKTGKKLK